MTLRSKEQIHKILEPLMERWLWEKLLKHLGLAASETVSNIVYGPIRYSDSYDYPRRRIDRLRERPRPEATRPIGRYLGLHHSRERIFEWNSASGSPHFEKEHANLHVAGFVNNTSRKRGISVFGEGSVLYLLELSVLEHLKAPTEITEKNIRQLALAMKAFKWTTYPAAQYPNHRKAFPYRRLPSSQPAGR
jgi:hypothetical protein